MRDSAGPGGEDDLALEVRVFERKAEVWAAHDASKDERPRTKPRCRFTVVRQSYAQSVI